MKLQRVSQSEQRYTTLGYWWWSKPGNRGELTVQVSRMRDWRHELAVWGHELIEIAYCKLFRVTTEVCDAYDSWFELKYKSGEVPPTVEAGDQKGCPYYIGHRMGVAWEHFCIFVTFAGWNNYVRACEEQMGIYERTTPAKETKES